MAPDQQVKMIVQGFFPIAGILLQPQWVAGLELTAVPVSDSGITFSGSIVSGERFVFRVDSRSAVDAIIVQAVVGRPLLQALNLYKTQQGGTVNKKI
jgi:hypothetical protein